MRFDYDEILIFLKRFGPMLHKIRYQRHINGLWARGFICGFLNRDEVNAVLGNEQIGTFLIRFSERNPGAFVIAYVAIEEGNSIILIIEF